MAYGKPSGYGGYNPQLPSQKRPVSYGGSNPADRSNPIYGSSPGELARQDAEKNRMRSDKAYQDSQHMQTMDATRAFQALQAQQAALDSQSVLWSQGNNPATSDGTSMTVSRGGSNPNSQGPPPNQGGGGGFGPIDLAGLIGKLPPREPAPALLPREGGVVPPPIGVAPVPVLDRSSGAPGLMNRMGFPANPVIDGATQSGQGASEQPGGSTLRMASQSGPASGGQPQAPAQRIAPVATGGMAPSMAYSRARDAAGRTGNSALEALRNQLTARGIQGSGQETLGTSNILGNVASTAAEAEYGAADDAAARDWEARKMNYEGGIRQRGDDLSYQGNIYGRGIDQRGQDLQGLLALLQLMQQGGGTGLY